MPAFRPGGNPLAQKMALLADSRSQGGLQVARIDDGEIPAFDNLLHMEVQFSRPVAPFAADGVTLLEDGLLVAIGGHQHRHNAITVAKQAGRQYRPVKVHVVSFVPGRQIPSRFLGIPGNG